MTVRPVAFVVVAALVVVGAATGAYLAVKHSGAGAMTAGAPTAPSHSMTPGPAQPGPTEVQLDGVAVEATEEVLDDVPEVDEPEPVPPRDEPVSPQPRREPLPAPDPAPSRSRDTVANAGAARPASEPSERRRPSDLPEVEGWTLSESWPSEPAEEEPPQVTLADISGASLGTAVAAEERPPQVEELIISADSVVGLQVDTPVSSENAQIEDDVEARVTRDVVVGDQIAIPAGTRVMGSVVLVEQAGKIQGASRLGVRFHTVVLDDGIEVPLVTETVYREGKSKGGASAGKIGGAAVGGAILGAIFGGRQGAAIGGAAGAAGGTAAAMAGDGQPATLPAGATVTVRLSQPATVTVERYPSGP